MVKLKITPREYDVLTRLHWRTKDIAQDLGVGECTVIKMYSNLSKKFNANSRAEIIVKALQYGIVELYAFI